MTLYGCAHHKSTNVYYGFTKHYVAVYTGWELMLHVSGT